MKKASIYLDRAFTVGTVDPRLFGSFLEHLGRAIYGGIYEPTHPLADEDGFRQDVLDLVKKLQIPIVRYPGGNFVSGFQWEDSIGPKASRKKRLSLAWKTTETNEFGFHEFMKWCKKTNISPMYSVNLGTRGADAARNIVEYANHPGGSYWSDLRIQNGSPDPFNIKLWCLGNEMDAPWQTGQKSAVDYGKTAREAAKLMKLVDPSIELVACGSTGPLIQTFGDWELTMLNECYDYVDYVSLHRYYENPDDDTANFLANTLDMDDFIHTVSCLCDSIKGKKHSKKTLNLSFDEWNVWYHSKPLNPLIQAAHCWETAPPLLQDVYTFTDALMIGGMLITLLSHADRIKIGCLAQLVNVIAPIMTADNGPAWVQTIFYPFAHVSLFGRGTVLQTLVDSPRYDSKDFCDVPFISAIAVSNENGDLTIFCLNREEQDNFLLSINLRDFPGYDLAEYLQLSHPDRNAVNSQVFPDLVKPVSGKTGTFENGYYQLEIPPLSWNVLRFKSINSKDN